MEYKHALNSGNSLLPTMQQQQNSKYHDYYGAMSKQHLPEDDEAIGMVIAGC